MGLDPKRPAAKIRSAGGAEELLHSDKAAQGKEWRPVFEEPSWRSLALLSRIKPNTK